MRTLQNAIPLDAAKLKQLYSTMLGCRMISERVQLQVKQGGLSRGVVPAIGQEATEVGALIDLLADDCVAPGPSDLNARFIRGTSLQAIFAHVRTRRGRNGFATPDRRRNAPEARIAPAFPWAAQLNLVTGVAWSLKRHAKSGVAVVFYNDDSESCLDAIRFSAAHKLPVLHIVHNSSLAISSSLEKSAASVHQPILPAFLVDGNDVVAVFRVAQEAIRRARQGHGPALIECQACSWNAERNTDSEGPRPSSAKAASGDPLVRMQSYLERKGLWSNSWKDRLAQRFRRQLDRAAEYAARSRD